MKKILPIIFLTNVFILCLLVVAGLAYAKPDTGARGLSIDNIELCNSLSEPLEISDDIVLEMNNKGLSMGDAEILWNKIEAIRSRKAYATCIDNLIAR